MDYRTQAMAEALQDKMLVAKMNAKELSEITGVSQVRLKTLLSGRETMSALELYTFCEIFKCGLEEFFVGVYNFPAFKHSAFPARVTAEFREDHLLTYFRQIKQTDIQDYICGFVHAIALNKI